MGEGRLEDIIVWPSSYSKLEDSYFYFRPQPI